MKKPVEVLWQIDPFGSSQTTPFIFNDQESVNDLNYKYLVLNRIGDAAKYHLK